MKVGDSIFSYNSYIYTSFDSIYEDISYTPPLYYIQYVILCLATATQNMIVTGASSTSMSSVEKAYKITSFHVGIYISIYNIFLALSSIPLTYLASFNKMRFINYGMLLIGIGSFIVIVPVIYVDPQLESPQGSAYLCSRNSKKIDNASQVQLNTLVFMFVGYALIGIGSAPFYNISYNFIYEKFQMKKASLFIAIYMISGIAGGCFIYVLSRVVLTIPIHPWNKNNILSDSSSENFIGAYWILYLLGSVLMMFLFCFSKIVEIIFRQQEVQSIPQNGMKGSLNQFFSLFKQCISNFQLISIIISHSFSYLMRHSLTHFFLKFLEVQFNLRTKNAVVFGGVTFLIGMIFGFYISSVVVKKFLKTNRQNLIFNIAVAICSIVCLALMMDYCEYQRIQGLKYEGNEVKTFSEYYGMRCNCDLKEYLPVCFNNTKTYYSPCQVGCKNMRKESGIKMFTNCSINKNKIHSIIEGKCINKCDKIVLFIATTICFICCTALIEVPTMNLIRSYAGTDISNLVMGIQSSILRIILITGPVLFGYLFESACKLKRKVADNLKTSNCIEYDQIKLSSYILGVCVVMQLIFAVIQLTCLFVESRK